METIKALLVALALVALGACAVVPGSYHTPYGLEFMADE